MIYFIISSIITKLGMNEYGGKVEIHAYSGPRNGRHPSSGRLSSILSSMLAGRSFVIPFLSDTSVGPIQQVFLMLLVGIALSQSTSYGSCACLLSGLGPSWLESVGVLLFRRRIPWSFAGPFLILGLLPKIFLEQFGNDH